MNQSTQSSALITKKGGPDGDIISSGDGNPGATLAAASYCSYASVPQRHDSVSYTHLTLPTNREV